MAQAAQGGQCDCLVLFVQDFLGLPLIGLCGPMQTLTGSCLGSA
jgi:hypothetical protein